MLREWPRRLHIHGCIIRVGVLIHDYGRTDFLPDRVRHQRAPNVSSADVQAPYERKPRRAKREEVNSSRTGSLSRAEKYIETGPASNAGRARAFQCNENVFISLVCLCGSSTPA